MALALFFTTPLKTDFLVIYLACVMSDVLDGFIARRTNSESRLGEKLDSLADLTLVTVLMIILLPIIVLPVQIIVWIAIIAAIRLVSIIVALAKYRTLLMLHTYGNKITGFVLCMFPFALAFSQSHEMWSYLICGIASLSALEELMIHLTSNHANSNRKSMFEKMMKRKK